MKKIEFTIDLADNCRLDKIFSYYSDISRIQVRKLIKSGACYVNGKRILVQSRNVKKGDKILLYISDEKKDNKTNYKIDDLIVYKDKDIIVANKPANLDTQSSRHNVENCLESILKKYLNLNYIYAINRIDKLTSGIVVFGLNKNAVKNLSEQFKENTVKKQYYAFCYGTCKNKFTNIENYLKKINKNNISKVVSNNTQIDNSYKYAKTFVNKIWQINNISCLKIYLYTGRTHQIRVHLKDIGLSIIGDPIYGIKNKNDKKMLLFANYIKFKHPISKKDMEFNLSFESSKLCYKLREILIS